MIKDAKRKLWREFCGTIGEKTDISDLWGMIRKMGGIQRCNNLPVFISDGNSEKPSNFEEERCLWIRYGCIIFSI